VTTYSASTAVVVTLDGREVVLAPQAAALVRAVVRAADRMRGTSGYTIWLHVKNTRVVAQYLVHGDDVPYAPD